MKRILSLSIHSLPGVFLIVAGLIFQRFDAGVKEKAIWTLDSPWAFDFAQIVQIVLVGVFSLFIALLMRHPLSRTLSLWYTLISLIVLLWKPMFVAMASRHVYLPFFPEFLDYTNFLIRPIECLSWLLVFGMGCIFLIASLFRHEKRNI